MPVLSPDASVHPDRNLTRLVWLVLALLVAYLCIAMSLPMITVS